MTPTLVRGVAEAPAVGVRSGSEVDVPRISVRLCLGLLGACSAPTGLRSEGADLLARGGLDPRALGEELLLTSAATSDHFGDSVAMAGDVNGDGFGDLVVGAPSDTFGVGRAFVYLGTAAGIDPASEIQLTASDGTDGDLFGLVVAGAGDVDGDGYDDVVVGAYSDDDRGNVAGSAYLFRGGSVGTDPAAQVKLEGAQVDAYDHYGGSVAGVGDLDADGYDDVMIGAAGTDGGGAVYLHRGGPGGIEAKSEARLLPDGGALWAPTEFGSSVVGLGDVNGDGFPDVAVGSSVGARVFHGGPGGLVGAAVLDPSPSGSAIVGAAGDVDGDGYDDLVLGSPVGLDDTAYVYLGGPAGIAPAARTEIVPREVNGSDEYGWTVAGGDVDGDGFSDVVVGASHFDGPGEDSGSAYVWFGSAAGIDPTSEARLVGSVAWEDDFFGAALAVGDLDGDGAAEVVAGAPMNTSFYEGKVYLFGPCVAPRTWFADEDHDEHGDPATGTVSCIPPYQHVLDDTDCDDADGRAWEDKDEECNRVDDDCNGLVDDDPVDGERYFPDADGDGHGDPDARERFCELPEGYTTIQGDCDDAEPEAWSGLLEACDGVDNDCDGRIDEEAIDPTDWYADADGDGHGDGAVVESGCAPPVGYVGMADDCDDAEPLAWARAEEACDGVDNNCDGTIDAELDCDPEGKGPSGSGSGSGSGCATGDLVPPGVLGFVLALPFVRRRRR